MLRSYDALTRETPEAAQKRRPRHRAQLQYDDIDVHESLGVVISEAAQPNRDWAVSLSIQMSANILVGRLRVDLYSLLAILYRLKKGNSSRSNMPYWTQEAIAV